MGTDRDSVKKSILRVWIIWGAMFFSLFIYVALCHILAPSLKPIVNSTNFPIDTLKNSLFVASIAAFFFSIYIRKFILNPESKLTRFNQIASQTNIDPAILRYQTAVIISVAISESIGIFGLVIFFLSKDINTLYIFIGMSATAMIYNIPKRSEIEQNR
ncbi:MAG: hypothetical protein HQK64_11685 [Desulfamplus sp.]|nr:hypothetical protein [Desulfamplus sp.]